MTHSNIHVIYSETDFHTAYERLFDRRPTPAAVPLSLLQTYARMLEYYVRPLEIDYVICDLDVEQIVELFADIRRFLTVPLVLRPHIATDPLETSSFFISRNHCIVISDIASWPLADLKRFDAYFLDNPTEFLEPWALILETADYHGRPFSLARFEHRFGASDDSCRPDDWTSESVFYMDALDRPCSVCEAFKLCGGWFLENSQEHCAWLVSIYRAVVDYLEDQYLFRSPTAQDINKIRKKLPNHCIPQRKVLIDHPGSAPILFLYHLSFGIGDRIVLQVLLKHWRHTVGMNHRIILATQTYSPVLFSPEQFADKPSEIWQLTFIPSNSRDYIIWMHDLVGEYYPAATDRRTIWYGPPNLIPINHPDIDAIFAYSHINSIVDETDWFPRFDPGPAAREEVERLLGCEWPGAKGRPVVAVHCRQIADHLDNKNLNINHMLDLIDRLRSERDAFIIGIGGVDMPRVLQETVDYVPPFDPSLQIPAAVLERCYVFIGGDSGPMHLAAAVGAPVILIQNLAMGDYYGPFCPPEHIRKVSGYTIHGAGTAVSLGFDIDEAYNHAVSFFEKKLILPPKTTPC